MMSFSPGGTSRLASSLVFADEPRHQRGDIGNVVDEIDALPAAPDVPPRPDVVRQMIEAPGAGLRKRLDVDAAAPQRRSAGFNQFAGTPVMSGV